MGHFQITQLRPRPVCHHAPVSGQTNRRRIHADAAQTIKGKYPVGKSSAQQNRLGPVDMEDILTRVHSYGPGYGAVFIGQQIIPHATIMNLHSPLAGLPNQNNLLIHAVVLQKCVRPPRQGVSGKIIATVMFHRNAPGIPHFDDLAGFVKKRFRPVRSHLSQTGTVLKLHDVVDECFVIAVYFRNIANKMIVAEAAAAAASGIAFIHNNATHPVIGRIDRGHKSGYTSSNTQEICFVCFNRKTMFLHISTPRTLKVYTEGMGKMVLPSSSPQNKAIREQTISTEKP